MIMRIRTIVVVVPIRALPSGACHAGHAVIRRTRANLLTGRRRGPEGGGRGRRHEGRSRERQRIAGADTQTIGGARWAIAIFPGRASSSPAPAAGSAGGSPRPSRGRGPRSPWWILTGTGRRLPYGGSKGG